MLQQANLDGDYDEEKDDAVSPSIKQFTATLSKLFAFGSRSARQKALTDEMKGLAEQDQKNLKQEYLIRESMSVKRKTEKMSIKDFDVIKVLGMRKELIF
jgi:hypothetical protein